MRLKRVSRYFDLNEAIIHVLQNDVSEEEMAFSEWFHSSSENKICFSVKRYDHRKGGLMPDSEEMKASWNRLMNKWRIIPTHLSIHNYKK